MGIAQEEQGIEMHTSNPHTKKAEAGGHLQVQDQLDYRVCSRSQAIRSEELPQNN